VRDLVVKFKLWGDMLCKVGFYVAANIMIFFQHSFLRYPNQKLRDVEKRTT